MSSISSSGNSVSLSTLEHQLSMAHVLLSDQIAEYFLYLQMQDTQLPSNSSEFFQWYGQCLSSCLNRSSWLALVSSRVRVLQMQLLQEQLKYQCQEFKVTKVFAWFDPHELIGVKGEEFLSLAENRKTAKSSALVAKLNQTGVDLSFESLNKIHILALRMLLKEKFFRSLPILALMLSALFAIFLLIRLLF